MKQIFLIVALTIFSCTVLSAQQPVPYGPHDAGFRLASDSANHFSVVNDSNRVVMLLDTAKFDVDSVIREVKSSNINDHLLIARILEMHEDPAGRKKELLYVSRNYDEIALMILRQLEPRLKN